jgi:hypothetical protein
MWGAVSSSSNETNVSGRPHDLHTMFFTVLRTKCQMSFIPPPSSGTGKPSRQCCRTFGLIAPQIVSSVSSHVHDSADSHHRPPVVPEATNIHFSVAMPAVSNRSEGSETAARAAAITANQVPRLADGEAVRVARPSRYTNCCIRT